MRFCACIIARIWNSDSERATTVGGFGVFFFFRAFFFGAVPPSAGADCEANISARAAAMAAARREKKSSLAR